jgi:1-phosphatidylinositol phosphodiesterase
MAPLFIAALLFAIIVSSVLTRTRASGDSAQDQVSLASAALNEILTRAVPIAGESHRQHLDDCIVSYNTGTDDGCAKYQKTCNWMATFSDSTKLVEMNLPGTHDTSTCNCFILATFDPLNRT